MSSPCRSLIPLVGAALLTAAVSLRGQAAESLTEDQMREFLLNAKVVRSRQTGKGITSPYRLTLSDGKMIHDAAFQSVDEARAYMQFGTGRAEMNFRDSYKYNLAAYELAKMLGLGDMMPVTVERRWQGKTGALSWWLDVKMDEEQRIQKGIHPPDAEAWNRQMHKMRVFGQLVHDTDRNLGNVLISGDWHIWMIDFTRAFRLFTALPRPRDLVRCNRGLLENLRRLDAAELKRRTNAWLNGLELQGVMARRDKIVAHFDDLIAKKGEPEILYGPPGQ